MAPEAKAWFLAEVRYLASHSPAAATAFVARIRAARLTLAEHPRIGAPGLIPGTRRFVVGAYILTVRPRDRSVEILAMRHGRQSDAFAPDEAR